MWLRDSTSPRTIVLRPQIAALAPKSSSSNKRAA